MKTLWLRVAPCILLVILGFGALLWERPGRIPFGAGNLDFNAFYYPLSVTAFGHLREGDLPLWNPYLVGGMPYLGSIEAALLYPPNWIHVLLPAWLAFRLLLLGHLIFFSAGSWLYCRGKKMGRAASAFVAVATLGSPSLVLHLFGGHLTILHSFVWLPWILWALDRCLWRAGVGRACLLALALALQFLAGFPLFTWALLYFLPIYAFAFGWKQSGRGRRALFLIGAVFLALALISPQLLATADYASQAHRGELSYSQATIASFPPANLLTAVIPDCLGDARDLPYWGEWFLWEGSLYCGVTVLLLAFFGLRRQRFPFFWAMSGLVFLILCLGKYSLAYDAAYRLLPGTDIFRGIGKLRLFVQYSLIMLAGLGVDRLLEEPLSKRALRFLAYFSLAAGATAGACLLFILLDQSAPGAWRAFYDWVQEHQIVRTPIRRGDPVALSFRGMLASAGQSLGFLTAAAAVICWVMRRQKNQWPLLLGLLLASELGLQDRRYLRFQDQAKLEEPGRILREIMDREAAGGRVVALDKTPLLFGRFMPARVEACGGHVNALPLRFRSFLAMLSDLSIGGQSYVQIPPDIRAYRLLGARWLIAGPGATPPEGCELRKTELFSLFGRSYRLYEVTGVLPRAFLLRDFSTTSSGDSVNILLQGLLDRGAEGGSFVEGHPSLQPVPDGPVGEILFSARRGPGELVAEVELPAPALLVFVETYFSGWEATVDGEPRPIFPANHFMQAVEVEAGRHRVELHYRPLAWRFGAPLSLLAVVVCAAGLWWGYRRPA